MSRQYLAAMTVSQEGRYFVEMVGKEHIPHKERDDVARRLIKRFVELGASADRIAVVYIQDDRVTDNFELPPLRIGPDNRYIVFVRAGRVNDESIAELRPYIAEQFAKFAQGTPSNVQVIILDSAFHVRVSEVIQ